MSPDSLHGKEAMCELKFISGNLFLMFRIRDIPKGIMIILNIV